MPIAADIVTSEDLDKAEKESNFTIHDIRGRFG